MKELLSFGLLILIYAAPNTGYLDQVDYYGVYAAENNNPKIIIEQLYLAENKDFKYSFLFYDGASSIACLTKGTYKLRGKKLRLFPTSFMSTSGLIQEDDNVSSVKLRGSPETDIGQDVITIDKSRPKLYKASLTNFESGMTRLKPRYYIKQTKDQLSLCVMDLKTEQYKPQFIKKKINYETIQSFSNNSYLQQYRFWPDVHLWKNHR